MQKFLMIVGVCTCVGFVARCALPRTFAAVTSAVASEVGHK
jgi:hypothetical protein